ncbi:hypothetical protein PATSB16_24360 [Pandoraea thiooxydans]|nr:hypothetical protein PATSB16_24360 [Pandoraea thiooxydans]
MVVPAIEAKATRVKRESDEMLAGADSVIPLSAVFMVAPFEKTTKLSNGQKYSDLKCGATGKFSGIR